MKLAMGYSALVWDRAATQGVGAILREPPAEAVQTPRRLCLKSRRDTAPATKANVDGSGTARGVRRNAMPPPLATI